VDGDSASIEVINASDLPVTNVTVKWLPYAHTRLAEYMRPKSSFEKFGVIPPGATLSVSRAATAPRDGVHLTFTDAAGREWIRDQYGVLDGGEPAPEDD
jgi:hypothetical protein